VGGVRRQLIHGFRLTALTLALVAPQALAAQVRFEVSGGVARGPGLAVELSLQNSGDLEARDVFVEGELAGTRAHGELGSLAAGARRSIRLSFPGLAARPGRNALTLQIEYKPAEPKDAVARQQPGLLLLELGGAAPPVLGVAIEPSLLDVSAVAWVVLESLDRAPHRAALTVLLATGVNLLEAPREVAVPASGRLRVPLRLVRGDAPRGGRHAITVVAAPIGEPLEGASAGHGEIEIAADPARLPRLRPWLFALGALLLLAALLAELHARRARAAPID
jgi:hypothetical protein